MKKIFVLILFNLILSKQTYSQELNYLKLSALRGQHTFTDYKGGSTSLYLSSSDRFIDLYESIQTEDVSEIGKEVENAYENPYKTEIKLAQTIKYRDFLIKLSLYNSLIAEVNNPVFPELDLFNVRSNTLSIQKTFILDIFDDFHITSKILISNRWYINELFSLKEIVKDEIEVELEGGKTYIPIYLDTKVGFTADKNIFTASLSGIEITENDRYSYFILQTQYYRQITKDITLGLSASPLYEGDYQFIDTVGLTFKLEIVSDVSLESKVSELDTYIEGSLDLKLLNFNFGWNHTREGSYSELYVSNFYLKLDMKY
jgi:hypothetical protein